MITSQIVIPGKTDTGKFIKLLDSKETSMEVERNINLAVENKIKSTPTLFIQNRRILGARPKEVFEAIIKKMLNR